LANIQVPIFKMNTLYGLIKSTALFATAAAGVVGGFKIYQKWGRGEEVVPLILAWIFGLGMVQVIFWAVGYYIVGGAYKGVNPKTGAESIAIESHNAVLIVGVAISIFSVVKIYQKYINGEDVIDLIYKWLGALIFLFLFGYIIEAVAP
jgi:hypothetical protein